MSEQCPGARRIRAAFAGGRKAFIPFLTCGDPDIRTTEEIVRAMIRNGADLIELGIPFSDPMAEGPVIQEADMRALTSGTTIESIFDLVRELRKETDIPLVFMTYINPVYAYGTDAFLARCASYGVDGIIVPDVPFEERDELLPFCRKHGITLIPMIAPTSNERIGMIAREAEGFLYCVSSLGVTGVRSEISDTVRQMVAQVRQVSDIPCAIGFGIATADQARHMAGHADGVIVGSAIVKLIARHGHQAPQEVGRFVHEMRAALDS